MVFSLNVSGTLNVFRLLRDPSSCLPHHTVSTFKDLPKSFSEALQRHGEKVDIRAVVLDKDNCFAVPKTNEIHKSCKERFDESRRDYPGSKLLIVSNTAGTASVAEAEDLEKKTGVKVLPHSTKKPGCHPDIMAYFRNNKDSGVSSPQHVAIVGDRSFTDVMMANMMGSYAIWVRDGVVKDEGMFARFEKHLATFLWKRGYHPPMPREQFSG